MKPELVVVGHILNETIKLPDRTIAPVLGSPAAYCSVIASRLGVKTGVVTKIGTDMPRELLKVFSEAGVDSRGIKTEGAASTTDLLIYDTSGNKRAHYLKKATDIVFDDIPKDYLDAKIIYVCPMDYEVPLEAVKELSNLGKTLAVDLMGYGGATSSVHPDGKEQEGHRALKELVKYFHIVRASIEDAQYFFRTKEGMEEDIAYLFTEWGADIGIVTLGEKGAVITTTERNFRIPAFPARVEDCTGAGDAYSAGFLVEYLRTKDPYKSALFAAATASLVIEGSGGVLLQRMPTSSEVRGRISRAISEK